MKFQTKDDEQIYALELKSRGISEQEFIKRRSELIGRLKNFKLSQVQKANWRKNRWVYLKAIRRYHNSTAGKKFHKELGRFLATKDLSGLRYTEAKELIKPLTSMLTHAYIEYDYFMSIVEQVEYEFLTDFMYDEVYGILSTLRKDETLSPSHQEFLYRVTETASMVKALADKSGRSEAEVEAMWQSVKKSLLKGHKEEDEDFYSLLVGVLKKNLKI